MIISISLLQPVAALIAGILILVIPRLLNYIVAIYPTSSESSDWLTRCEVR
jgi:hypothetical protein